MKLPLPSHEHRSYKIHRRQFMTQILLPISTAFVLLGLFSFVILNQTITNGNADLPRLAAISTMWIALPALVIGVFLLGFTIVMIYLLALLLNTIPAYTKRVQDIVYKSRTYAIRGADMVVRPVIYIDGLLAHVRAFFGRK